VNFADWLALREPADAAARATDLVGRLAVRAPVVIHDLGSGTGSMARWLAPRLPGPQHWILYDRDADLLDRAVAGLPAGVTVQTRQCDITRLTAADLAGASLVTASALLDMLTADEVDRIVAACAYRPTLLTLSVTGTAQLTPADPLDARIAAAFNAHQRRTVGGRTLLGPDAADAAAGAFRRRGVTVESRSTPWRLGADQAELAAQWFTGWLDAAREQQPDLVGPVRTYEASRLAQAAAGRLGVVVGHRDLLAGADRLNP
jgi:hypothetical protein